jgi:hypothetical protein
MKICVLKVQYFKKNYINVTIMQWKATLQIEVLFNSYAENITLT